MGQPQGKGISYDASGRKLFEGQFARGGIQYEALVGQTLDLSLIHICIYQKERG